MTGVETIHYDDPAREPRAIDISSPEGPASNAALLFVHGGAWYSGDRKIFQDHIRRFADRGVIAASVGYRTSEDAGLLEKLDDVRDGYRVLLARLRALPKPVGHVIVVGSSAGAHLASLHTLSWPDAATAPSACVSINGPGTLLRWPDMHPDIRSSLERLCGASYDDAAGLPRFQAASPDHHLRLDPPAFLFIVVGQEQYFPHRYVYDLARALNELRGRARVLALPEAEHGYFYTLNGEDQQRTLAELDALVARWENSSRP